MTDEIKYTMGTPIPAKEILRRFKDEDGELFLEVRGMNDVLFRVTDGDRVYYKIEKAKMKGEELTLVEDNTIFRPKSVSFQDVPTAQHQTLKKEEDLDVDLWWPSAVEPKKKPVKPEEIKEFDEGESIPEQFRKKCTRNEYGGYTFRYKKFLYLLDSNYNVEIKSPDTESRYDLKLEPLFPPQETIDNESSDDFITLSEPLTEAGSEALPFPDSQKDAEIELQKGDLLPQHLRALCESQIGYGYGSRITLGNYLYVLDFNFKVIQKMKISYIDDGDVGEAKQDTLLPDQNAPGEQESSVDDIVIEVMKTFEQALTTYNVNAEYYKEAVLSPDNLANLIHAYHGDLSGLNDDTREAASLGKPVTLQENEQGLSLLKAILIHELYINSTLKGRGENMKYFLTHIITPQPEATEEAPNTDISFEEGKELLDFFKNQAFTYTDKTDVLRRVHLQIRNSLLEQYEELLAKKEKVNFRALLISKLYENTTRLDRGDGITMIRLTRDLLEYPSVRPHGLDS